MRIKNNDKLKSLSSAAEITFLLLVIGSLGLAVFGTFIISINK